MDFSNPFEMMKNLKNIKEQMETMQSKLDTVEASGNAGAGLVEITISGKFQVRNIKIDPSLMKADDPKTLEVLIAAAFNSAVARLQEVLASQGMEMLNQNR